MAYPEELKAIDGERSTVVVNNHNRNHIDYKQFYVMVHLRQKVFHDPLLLN